MTGKELIENAPLTTIELKNWFLKEIIESCENDPDLPPEFVDYLIKTGVESKKLADMFDMNPRMLFDFFDNSEICIQITGSNKEGWLQTVEIEDKTIYATRRDAEASAVITAFTLLELVLKSN